MNRTGRNHQHRISQSDTDLKNFRLAFFLNLGFSLVEVVGGLMTNSVAILSDALHDFGDSLTLGMAWYFQKVSKRDSDKEYSYGYARFSLVGAMVSALILIVGSVFIIQEAIPRIQNPEMADAPGMMILAVFGILINGYAAWRLHGGDSINEKVVGLHLLEDVLGWVAVLIGAVVMYFYDLPIIDPILSLGIAAFILINVFRNLRATFRIILQSIPKNVDLDKINDYFESISWVEKISDIHVWSLDGSYHIMTIHLVTNDEQTLESLEKWKSEARNFLVEQNVQHTTFEIEYESNHGNPSSTPPS